MQKVEGSNPFSRFDVNPLHTGNSPIAGETGTTRLIARPHRGEAATSRNRIVTQQHQSNSAAPAYFPLARLSSFTVIE